MSDLKKVHPFKWIRRWCIFNVVGVMGVVIQLAVLSILKGQLGLHYILATALAVESAVLHNFVWHERWTWVDRTGVHRRGTFGRLARFNLSTGIVSIASNLGLMTFFVDGLDIHYLPANLLSIGACSLVQFFVSDRFVFVGRFLHRTADSNNWESDPEGRAPLPKGGGSSSPTDSLSEASEHILPGQNERQSTRA